ARRARTACAAKVRSSGSYAGLDSSWFILCQSDAGKAPAIIWSIEVAVSGAPMVCGRRNAAASQHALPTHEFAVVFAQYAGRGLKAGIGVVTAGSPLPQQSILELIHGAIGRGNQSLPWRPKSVALAARILLGCHFKFGFR